MSAEDDLTIEDVPGYVPKQKKTLEEYAKLDENDESLKKWKASLGLGGEPLPVDPNDKKKVVIESMTLSIQGDPNPITIDLQTGVDTENIEISKSENGKSDIVTINNPFKLPEKSIYKLSCKFRVQHEIITGLTYVYLIKRHGIRVDHDQEKLGSYPPSTTTKPYYECVLMQDEAPSGMLARSTYNAVSKFIDEDKEDHLIIKWSFSIVKSK